MNSQLQLLIELQRYDLRIFEILDEQKKSPEQLRLAQQPLLELGQQLKQTQATGESLGKQRKDREQELSLQEEHIQKIRSRLNDLKTNKEYQAHLFEIELARKKKDTLEEAVLSVLEQVEQNTADEAALRTQYAEAESAFASRKAQLESHAASLAQELSTLEREHTELTTQVDRALLARYTKLKSLRKGFAIAEVRGGACVGCRLQLPPQLVAEVKRADELLNCSYCHRILYWDQEAMVHAETPPSTPSPVENAQGLS